MDIHFIQESYRKLLNVMAKPGEIESFRTKLKDEGNCLSFSFGSYVVMRMLLDTEVTFKAVSKRESDSDLIGQLTGSRQGELADYIFISLERNSEIGMEIERAKNGDLINPELSATIICEVKDLTLGEIYSIKGPGILNEKNIKLPLVEYWKEKREEKNLEYPMGIDLIFIDTFRRALAIPRTTEIKEV